VQIDAERAMTDQNIKDYIQAAYGIVMGKLTKAKRNELGLTLP
jgi:predicted DNA-binding protein (MmcQ/YjbR family)